MFALLFAAIGPSGCASDRAGEPGSHCSGKCDDPGSDPGLVTIPIVDPAGAPHGEWLVQTNIGGQDFTMLLDVGSASLAVAGSTCDNCYGVTPLYKPGASGVDQGMMATATPYGDGTWWSGEIYRDGVSLGHGLPTTSLPFVSITEQGKKFFVENHYQGIVGMTVSGVAVAGTRSYFDALIDTGFPAIMSLEQCTVDGTMWLGGYDPTHAAEEPSYTPLVDHIPTYNNYTLYGVQFDSMSIGAVELGATPADFGTPILDTGYQWFNVSPAVDAAALAAINGLSGFHALFGQEELFDNGCIEMMGVTPEMLDAQLPPMVVRMPATSPTAPDVTLTVPASRSYFVPVDGYYCYALKSSPGAPPVAGWGFLRAFVTVIDREHNRVGFAPDLGCSHAAHASSGPPFHVVPPRWKTDGDSLSTSTE
jgi:hypothetical protein